MESDNRTEGQKPGLSWSQPAAQQPGSDKTAMQKVSSVSSPKKTNTGKITAATAAGVIVLAIGAWVWTANQASAPTSGGTATTTNSNNSNGTANSGGTGSTPILLSNISLNIPSPQNAGLEVVVASAAVSEPTWVVIYENNNGTPGNALGAALFTKDRQSGVVELLRGTLPGQTYFAGEARDDGDHMFSMQKDLAIRDQNGNPLWLQFKTN